MTYERLTAADTAFLHLETPHEPQHVGSLSILEGGPLRDETGRIRFEEIREHVANRLHRVPRLRQRLMAVPYAQGRPIWVDDADFDIDYHVRLTALPRPGTDTQLSVLMARLQAQALDRARPLWEIWIVDGLSGDHVAMIIKTHHAMGDGIASVDMALALVDLSPEVIGEKPPQWRPQEPPTPNRLLVDSLWDQARRPGELARAAFAAARDPRPLIRSATSVVRTASEFLVTPEPAPWNTPVSAHRRWVHADISMDAVRCVREHRSVTINDVVLAACSGALRTFLEGRGATVDDRVVKAMVPVSLRSEDEHGATLGNRVSMVMVELPVDDPDPVRRLETVHRRAAKLKDVGLVEGAERIVNLADGIPLLSSSLTRIVTRTVPMNLVITNVPGPPVTLYLQGARILRTYPYVEVIDDEGLTIAVVSYEDHLFFGITADRDVMSDLDLVAEAIEKEFLALADAMVHSSVEPVRDRLP